MSNSLAFERHNKIRQAWVLNSNLSTETIDRLAAIPKKQRFELYKEIDKEVSRLYISKLKEINQNHIAEGKMQLSKNLMAISSDPVAVSQVLVEAANEAIITFNL